MNSGSGSQLGQQASLTKTVTEADVTTFAELIGDDNPFHMDVEYARQSRFGRRVAHGMLSGGLISAVLGNQAARPWRNLSEPAVGIPGPGLYWGHDHGRGGGDRLAAGQADHHVEDRVCEPG